MSDDITNLLLWIAFGGVIGFIYAYRRVARHQAHLQKSVDEVALLPSSQRELSARFAGYRVGAGLTFFVVGGIGGALIWSVAKLVAWIAG